MNIEMNQSSFNVGDKLVITCDVKKDGYLNILNVSPGDEKATVLFPNRIHKENQVKAGTSVTIPNTKIVLNSKQRRRQATALLLYFLLRKRSMLMREVKELMKCSKPCLKNLSEDLKLKKSVKTGISVQEK